MGLKFRIFTKAEHYTMPSAAALLRKVATASAASPAATPAAPPAPTVSAHVAGGGGNRGNRGKGPGNQPLTQAQIDAKAAEAAARKAEAEADAAEAKARSLRAQADAAEAQARLKAAQSTAVVPSTPRAKPCATSVGGDYITREEFNSFQMDVKTGFKTLVQQNDQTHQVLASFVKMMNPGLPASATAPVSRQIGNSPQEVVEQRQISFGQNAGWDLAAEGSGRFAQSSSQFSHDAGVACGGGATQSFYRESVPTATSRTSTPKFDAAVARWNVKGSLNNGKILQAIRDATLDDNRRCMLLALVNGKTYSEITNMYDKDVASLLSTRNTPFFQSFFTALTHCGLPANFDVKVDSSKTKSGHGFCMTYQQLSQAPGHVDRLVKTLCNE